MNGYLITKDRFFFGKSSNGFSDFEDIVWRPNQGELDLGIAVFFHGSPPIKYDTGRKHVTAEDGGFIRIKEEGADHLTGINSPTRFVYYPKDPDDCWYGNSYATTGLGSGIGLYSYIGRDFSGNLPFMLNKRNYSSNPKNFGLYVHFPCLEGQLEVFSGPMKTLECRAGQQVKTHEICNYKEQQLQQKMSFVIVNKHAYRHNIEYSFNTFIQGLYEDKDTASLWIDPDQGNAVVISGKLGPSGISTEFTRTDITAYTSTGNPSQTLSNGQLRRHKVEISWQNFQDMMVEASHRLNAMPEKIFGPKWEKRDTWILSNARFAHEVHNGEYENHGLATIGSRLQYMQILPL